MAVNQMFSAGLGTELARRPVYTNHIAGQSSKSFKRFYSQIDAEIYLGSTYVDDIIQIDWNVFQRQMPIYGYNSFVYDAMALGARLISGCFTVNFTSPNYLNEIIAAAGQASLTAVAAAKIRTDHSLGNEVPAKAGQDFAAGAIWEPSFDIDIVFGQKNALTDSPCHVILEGVRLESAKSALSAMGGVFCEAYQFTAKDIKTLE